MNTTPPSSIKVWDLPVRLFHWSLAGAFLLSYLSGENDLEQVHSYFGYFIASLLVFRLLWGFIGTRHARFGSFIQRPAVVLDYLKQALSFRSPRYLGHNPAGGAMVVALLLVLALTTLSGMALYGATDFAGPMAGWFRGAVAAELLEEIHEVLANLCLFLIAFHLAGVLFSSLSHRENLVKAMFTGHKREQHYE